MIASMAVEGDVSIGTKKYSLDGEDNVWVEK